MNARTALLGLFVALTIVLASTTVYESGIRTTLTSTSTFTSTSTVTAISVSTITATSTVDPTEALKDAYLSHIVAIETENATALGAQYETNASLLYAQNALPPKASFDGTANIAGFYTGGGPIGTYRLKAPFAVANETYSITMSNDLNAGNVTSHLVFYGNDTECPVVANGFSCPSGTAFYHVIGMDISYFLQGDRWLISMENLTNINSELCIPVSLSSDGSVLTCPTLQIPS